MSVSFLTNPDHNCIITNHGLHVLTSSIWARRESYAYSRLWLAMMSQLQHYQPFVQCINYVYRVICFSVCSTPWTNYVKIISLKFQKEIIMLVLFYLCHDVKWIFLSQQVFNYRVFISFEMLPSLNTSKEVVIFHRDSKDYFFFGVHIHL